MNSLKYFTSARCGPCKLFKPTIEKLKENKDYNISIMDVDSNFNEFSKYGVVSVPSLIFENDNGEVIANYRGAVPEEEIIRLLSK
ncbi:thioredoxin family protein [bacterium]|nr:thioredoxin family protein [bacterium]